ncbi:hypothetical protein, partial [Xanthomonas euvesicatoria]|uniref:hypothetical protein n=1 Tax=Xanthomonas euvesicatoria TaxID=456327 RepID=UPI0019D37B00
MPLAIDPPVTGDGFAQQQPIPNKHQDFSFFIFVCDVCHSFATTGLHPARLYDFIKNESYQTRNVRIESQKTQPQAWKAER